MSMIAIDIIDFYLSVKRERLFVVEQIPIREEEIMWKYDATERDDQIAADWPSKPIPLPPQPEQPQTATKC